MAQNPIVHAATESTKAIVYQLCVAVEKCYEMQADEKVYVEKLGDVTIENREQAEVKDYTEPLTDGHENFWKTLKNWVSDEFDSSPYSTLVLYTTQKFGEKATISSFNDLDTSSRLDLIRAIHAASEDRMAVRLAKDAKATPSAVLKYQRYVFDSSREGKLHEVIEKMVIEARVPKLPQLYAKIKQVWMKGVLEGKKSDFLNTLIGFIAKPDAVDGEEWEITYKDFCSKVAELHGIYGSETRRFPRACFDSPRALNETEISKCQDYDFVKKIKDIQYHEMVQPAIQEYLQTVDTIHNEFKTYSVSKQRTNIYSNEVVKRFNAEYRRASRNCSDVIANSQDFYDARTGEESLQFDGFENRPLSGFRNGVLHMEMNEDDNLFWRLKVDE